MEQLRASAGHHTNYRVILTLFVLFCVTGTAGMAENVLIYTRNGEGYVHDNIPASVACLEKICARQDWTCEVTDDPSIFTADAIKAFDAVIFCNTNNEAFETDAQRHVFKDYIQNGGGFVGVHSACGSERQWPWFWANLGGKFVRHPKLQPFKMKVIDKTHPSTAHLENAWAWEDECYFMDELNPRIHVLLAVDLKTVEDDGKQDYPGRIFGDFFPLVWCQEFDGGRQWYTALGHKDEHYEDENYIKHLTGGIQWVMRKETVKKSDGKD